MKEHNYQVTVEWTGNQGSGTRNYRSYSRDHLITAPDKELTISGSSDPAFRGDPQRYNPEELFLSSISSCHMLWYLHLCATHKIVVISYIDQPIGIMQETANGSGKFNSVVLHPEIMITHSASIDLAQELHKQAHELCFIANSCNFPITHQAVIKTP